MDKDTIKREHFIFGCLFLLANRLQVIGDRLDKDITMKQWFLMVMISQWKEDPPMLSEVADFIGSSRQNVKQLALKIEKRGFLSIEKDEKDSRILRLRLTKKCEEFFKAREDREEKCLEYVYDNFTEEEMNSLYKCMYKLSENIFKLDELSKGGPIV